MDKQPVGQLPDLTQSNNDDEIMVITNDEYNQLKKEKISDFITDLTSTDENNAIVKGTDGKLFTKDFGNASNITEGTLPTSVLPTIPLDKIPDIPKSKLPVIETTDLPTSGVTADTYAYPSSVTVNAQGMVTAIEEGTPSGSNANVDLSNITEAGKEVIKENSGGGLELLDIGIAPCGIDETQNLRRYLNGQVIQQSQFADAVSKLKTMIGWSTETQTAALLPNLVCSEEEWQAAKTASAHSQVGKFVIDDTAGTVRLPAIVNIQGVFSLQNSGLTAPAGLPNITGEIGPFAFITAGTRIKTGAFTGSDMPTSGGNSRPGGSSENELTIDFDASNASSIYGSSDTVQQEAVQYPFFIQLATGQETEANIINEIELNNPYTLFDSKYVEAPLYNTSWLLSNNSYYTKAVYPSAYDALVVEQNTNINPGDSVTLPSGGTYVKRGLSVKLSSETFDDYDFVLNTTNETFRLPIKNGQEGMFPGEVPDGWGLYYYIGETIQNASLINAGRLSEQLAEKANRAGDWFPRPGGYLLSNYTLGSNANLVVDLSDILPNDDNYYEISVMIQHKSASGGTVGVKSYNNNDDEIAMIVARSQVANVLCESIGIVYVTPARKIVCVTGGTSVTSCYLAVNGYRKIDTPV